ncbi:hypothetical protein GGI23_002530 [Coemansia sp. RSA 2559]|nr:hypothetical protein GGI23_002530 [Coemansia sp. RSA 2559]KAJ2868973.1 hypothetical protein GGI22_000547 [Coemansia erecta]
MARAADLLPEIVRLILRSAITTDSANDTGGSTLREWKRYLALLGVCRKWRAMGVPLVYSQVIVESSSLEDSDAVVTNAVLFGGMHGQPTDVARALTIVMAAHARVNVFLGNVCDCLAQRTGDLKGQQWRRVHTVTLDLCAGGPYLFASTLAGNEAETHGASEETQKTLADRLTRALPGVKTLHCAPSQNIDDCAEFTACVADHYARQIERLKTHVHAPFAAPAAMPCLRTLDLFFFLPSVQLTVPQINVRQLQRMSLVNVSAAFAWDALFPQRTDEGANSAVFASLRRMHLFFHTHVDVFESNARATKLLGAQYCRRLSFPRLRFLCTDNSASAATLLSSAQFPDRVAEFRVFCPEGAIISIKNADFSGDARRRIAAYMATPHEARGPWDFVRLTNCLFSPSPDTELDKQEKEVLALTIGAHMFLPKPSVITWAALTRLSIGAPICPFALTQYIGALPALIELRVHSMQLGSVVIRSPDTHNSADNDSLCLWPPSPAACSINESPIRFLALAFDAANNGDTAASVVEYLVAQLHCIHTLCIPNDVAPRVQAFAASQATAYPHLANLSIH